MLDKIFDRRNIVVVIVFIAMASLLFRLADLTIIQGEYYRHQADRKFEKQVTLSAKRGEIYDTNGKLLAGNIPSYTVQVLETAQSGFDLARVSVDLLSLLEERDESYIAFPIQYLGGSFEFTDDLAIRDWLIQNGFEEGTSATEVYSRVRGENFIDEDLDVYTAQKLLLYKGISLPISVKSMKFLNEIYKENFLASYNLGADLTAQEAYEALRDHPSFNIDDAYDEGDGLKIMTVRHALNASGHYSYIPTDISINISKETAVIIQERKMDFPGISVVVEPIRDYPYGDSAAHVIGYMGKISTEREINRYINERDYDPNDLIGKTGLENAYEDVLHGEDGYKFVYADALGNYIGDFIEGVEGREPKASHSGDNIRLTIDIDMQQTLEDYLAYTLEQIQTGGTYESEFGNINYDQFENAQTGAAVVVKVDTGEILAMASHPTYDLNLFSTGISSEDWASLQPENPRNPLAPRPLYNIATNTAVQPGSTFKMVTTLAAIEQGLDPYEDLFTNGVVMVGDRPFRCWYYQAPYHGIHGNINSMEAIQVSCNYFMFDIVRGYDYYRKKPLDFIMNTETLLDYSLMLGLGEYTGVEIYEENKGLPSEELKISLQKYYLKRFLDTQIHDYFSDADLKDESDKTDLINTIVGWADEYMEVGISRNEITRRLIDLGAVTSYSETELLTDLIVYSYFNRISWKEGDDLNLSIGQGDHRYTVLQIARMVSTLANGGYLHDLTLVKEVDGQSTLSPAIEPQPLNDLNNLSYIKEGMRMSAHERGGSAYQTFYKFPMTVGAKTGTAQQAGRIPEKDEVEYIRTHLKDIIEAVNGNLRPGDDGYLSISLMTLEAKTNKILEERNTELVQLQQTFYDMPEGEEKMEFGEDIERMVNSNYLDHGTVMRIALKELGQDRINDDMINEYRELYDPFAWFVSFAPFDDPELAVVVMIPQGGHGSYAAPMVRQIYADYFGIELPDEE